MTMVFDTKIAIVLRDDLEPWQRLNVTAFVAGAIVGHYHDIIGQPYRDAANNEYMRMCIQPIMIYQADANGIRKAYARAMERQIRLAIFTTQLFSTQNDVDNRMAIAEKIPEDLELVGIAMRDLKKSVDYVIKGLKLHP